MSRYMVTWVLVESTEAVFAAQMQEALDKLPRHALVQAVPLIQCGTGRSVMLVLEERAETAEIL